MDFLIEDGLVKTKGYSEVFIDTTKSKMKKVKHLIIGEKLLIKC